MIYAYYKTNKAGVEPQKRKVLQYCENHDLSVEKEFLDSQLSELVDILEDGDKIIVQDTSRLWVSEEERIALCEKLRNIGADIINVSRPTYSVHYNNPYEFLYERMTELTEQYQSMVEEAE